MRTERVKAHARGKQEATDGPQHRGAYSVPEGTLHGVRARHAPSIFGPMHRLEASALS